MPLSCDMPVNLRELGGIATADGRKIRPGLIYRSGDLSRLGEEAKARMIGLGLAARIDFRGVEERTAHPQAWHAPGALQVWENVSDRNEASIRYLLDQARKGAIPAHQAMRAVYRDLPIVLGPCLAILFRWLADGRVPILYSCSAGKDRTGAATALLLWSLGVEHETIIAEYELSNREADAIKQVAVRAFQFQDDDALKVVLSADRRFVEGMIEDVERKFGSIEGYLKKALNFNATSLKRLRDRVLD